MLSLHRLTYRKEEIMAADPRIDELKTLLDSINADDVAEDAAFQAQIDSLSTSLVAKTEELTECEAECAALEARVANQESRIATLEAMATNFETRIHALEPAHEH